MGRYMRKRVARAGAPAVELAQVAVGVSTRARSAAAAAAVVASAAPAPKRARKQRQAAARAEGQTSADEFPVVDAACGAAGCYLERRSRRRLSVAAAAGARCRPVGTVVQSGASGSGEPVVAAVVAGTRSSTCSSTESSADVVVASAAAGCRGGAAEAREDHDAESAVSDSAGCLRERREATPSSRPPPPVHYLGDGERGPAAAGDPKPHRPAACRARTMMPPAEEVEQFFAAAEEAEAQRFAAKYNFDVARGLPLGPGRFEWTPVASG